MQRRKCVSIGAGSKLAENASSGKEGSRGEKKRKEKRETGNDGGKTREAAADGNF